MSSNPFNRSLDWALQGKYARVHSGSSDAIYEGWIDRVHHQKSSIVLHSALRVDPDDPIEYGSVWVRMADEVAVLKPRKRVENWNVWDLSPFPDYDIDFDPAADIVRNCYRNQFAGGFPVVRTDGTIINGHKRVRACKIAGLDTHPCEVIDVTDEQARELFELAHPDNDDSDVDSPSVPRIESAID